MEPKAGTQVKGKTFKRESTIDCRAWIEFEITEITMSKVRVAYRVPRFDRERQTTLESSQQAKTH